MTEPAYLSDTRAAYDTVAESYAGCVPAKLAEMPMERGMLAAFAGLVRVADAGPVADVGCGPGHVTAYLDDLGVPAFGIDLSPRMVEVARRTYPGLRFTEGTMTALDLKDGELGGVLAWWSIIHTPPEVLPVVFGEFHRTLAPGGHVLMGFHVGDERVHSERAYGHAVCFDGYRLPPDRVAELLGRAGFVVTARLLREPDEGLKYPQACLLARKP